MAAALPLATAAICTSGWPIVAGARAASWRLYAGACALSLAFVALSPQPPLFKLITLAALFVAVFVVLLRLSRSGSV